MMTEITTARIESRLDALAKKLDSLIHLQHFALLGPERVIEFVHEDNVIAMHIPFALHDHIQQRIFTRRNFYEFALLAKMRQMALFDPRGVYVDIGANIGNHAVYFGKVMGARHVTCFEPQNVSYAILQKNIALNDLAGRSRLVQTLLGETAGRGAIVQHHGGRNLGATAFGASADGDFPIIALDDYCAGENITAIDFMKIDVEGMQLAVLGGARQVLGDIGPVLWVELLQQNNEFAATNDFLQLFGYRAVPLDGNNYLFSKS